MCDFMDDSESNIKPSLGTQYGHSGLVKIPQYIRERYSEEILATLDLEPKQMNSVFAGLSCRRSDE